MKIKTMLVSLMIMALLVAGAITGFAEEDVKIGFSFGQSVHPFFIAMEKGARQASQENNVELFVASANYEVSNQLKNVDNLLQKDIDALLLNPVDSQALSTVVKEANDKGVPVITVDIAVEGALTASHISSNNKDIGRKAANYVIDKLNGKGKIAIIGLQTVSSTLNRQKGFVEIMEETEGIEIVATTGDGMERAKAMEKAENVLQAHRDLDFIFGVNESSAMGALSAVSAQGLDVPIIGVDSTPAMLEAIKRNTSVKATVAQNPFEMGRLGVELALEKINGNDIPEERPVKTDLITVENVDKFIERSEEYNK